MGFLATPHTTELEQQKSVKTFLKFYARTQTGQQNWKQIGSVAGIEEDRGEMRQRGREVRLERFGWRGKEEDRSDGRENKLKE
jgi:hypothetical protein